MLILRGHSGPVRCLAYSPEGQLLASGSDDGKVKLWYLHPVRQRQTLTVNGRLEDWVRAMAFASDGKTLAAGDWGGWIRLWKFTNNGRHLRAKGRLVQRLRWYAPWAMTFTPNCLSLAVGRSNGEVELYWLRDLANPRSLREHEWPVNAVVFSPDGRILATGGHDRTVRLWDAEWGRQQSILATLADWVRCLAFSPDGRTLASGSEDATIRLWDVANGQEKAVFTGHTASVRQVVFSLDGRSLFSASWDETVRIWDVTTGCQRAAYNWQIGRVHCLALAPDGMTAAAGGHDHSIVIWDVE